MVNEGLHCRNIPPLGSHVLSEESAEMPICSGLWNWTDCDRIEGLLIRILQCHLQINFYFVIQEVIFRFLDVINCKPARLVFSYSRAFQAQKTCIEKVWAYHLTQDGWPNNVLSSFPPNNSIQRQKKQCINVDTNVSLWEWRKKQETVYQQTTHANSF